MWESMSSPFFSKACLFRQAFFFYSYAVLPSEPVRRLYFDRSAKAGSILKPVEQQILSIIGINPKTGSILKPVELEKLSINIS